MNTTTSTTTGAALDGFTHTTGPARIVFGRGSLAQVPEEVKRAGVRRALVLTSPEQAEQGAELASSLGDLAAGVFTNATMHTPVAVTAQAVTALRETNADGVVALGGGSTTGLGKAIASRTGVPQVVVPTTYAGSEVTPVLGETEHGVKTTRSGLEILPEVVIYDPSLTDTLPAALTVTSGLNAMAHALEGLYARDGSPVFAVLATEGLRAFRDALPALHRDPSDQHARDAALYGAWLCGTVLGGVGMSVHHKLCHTLGGSLDLPHAPTHAILLPHTIAFVAEAAAPQLAPARDLFGTPLGATLHDFTTAIGAPQRLSDLGVAEADLDRVADLALTSAYWTPRPLDRQNIRALLQDAWAGHRPGSLASPVGTP
ncbi:maleylacetate reductase [Promicromonospora sp. NPDC057138]|uniref:maleylacetate reductase n=1 Tax=Promicromonospora sp. NPDC057138 TaxID=3346031 RepID=UPI00363B21A1